MGFAAGETVTAGKLNRLQPKTYFGVSSSDLAGAVTDTDIPGCTVTFTTVTDNATFDATGFVDFDNTGAITSVATAVLVVDGAAQSGLIVYQQGLSSDQMSPGGMWNGTLAAAGSHTLKLIATLPAGISARNPHSKLRVNITEIV